PTALCAFQSSSYYDLDSIDVKDASVFAGSSQASDVVRAVLHGAGKPVDATATVQGLSEARKQEHPDDMSLLYYLYENDAKVNAALTSSDDVDTDNLFLEVTAVHPVAKTMKNVLEPEVGIGTNGTKEHATEETDSGRKRTAAER